jgi:ABC-type glycerol-3-phosphate transport system permease component
MKLRLKRKLKKAMLYIIIIIVLTFILFPIYWTFVNSLKPISEIRTQSARLIPAQPTLENYRSVTRRTEFQRYLLNSLVVTTAVVFLSILVSIFTGYALSRYSFFGKQAFSIGLLASQTLPPILLIIPLFLILRKIGLVNTYQGLTLTYLTIVLPFSSWMLRGYFDTIPVELEQAAMIDGCSRVGTVFRVVLPLSAPGVAAVAIFSFILAWQDYLFALTIMTSQKMMTATVGIASFIGAEEIKWGQMGAFASIMIAPTIVFFVLVQKFVVQGLTMGAVKE